MIIIVAFAGYVAYSLYYVPLTSGYKQVDDSCIPYLRTNCGGNNNAIGYDPKTGDITVSDVGQSYGVTWYNVVVAYVPGNPAEPTGVYFQQDSADFPSNTLNSGQSVTVHSLNVTGPATAGASYNGSLWIAYTLTSGGQDCAGSYQSGSGCKYGEIGTITLAA